MSAQAEFLSYYGQQLIAHGATLFAILTAAFTFMAHVRPRGAHNSKWKKWRQRVFVIIAGVLLSVGFQTLFRIMYYGAIITQVVQISDGKSLSDYSETLYYAVEKSGWLGWFLVHMGYSSTFGLFALLFSLGLGFIGALLIYFVTYENVD